MVYVALITLFCTINGMVFHHILERPAQEYKLPSMVVKQYQAEYVFLGKRLHGVIVRTSTKEEKNLKLYNHPLIQSRLGHKCRIFGNQSYEIDNDLGGKDFVVCSDDLNSVLKQVAQYKLENKLNQVRKK